ncbi:MAG: GNAT family N-acetyltransferase [Pseudomonadota bacterium]
MTRAAPYRYAKTLSFRRINPAYDAPTLIRFGRDLYVESLGDARRFYRDYGVDGARFPLWIATCAARPGFATFLTEDNREIGMIILGADQRRPDIGHVHHLYVAPSHRGQGFGGLLDDYGRATLKSAGYQHAELNVTPQNARARRFYDAQGWREKRAAKSGGLVFMVVDL